MDTENISQQEPIQTENINTLKKREAKFGKRFFIVLTLALFFVASITSAFVYVQNTPERVIDNMVAKMSALKSAHYEGSIQMGMGNMEDAQVSESSYDKMQNMLGLMSLVMADGHLAASDVISAANMTDFLAITGDTNMLDLNNPKNQFSIVLTEFGIGLDAKVIGEDIYLKLQNEEQGGEFIEMFDLSMFQDQWLKITVEDIEQTWGVQGLSEEIEKQQQAAELTEEQVDQIENLAKEIEWYEIKEILGKEMMGEEDVYHYQISLLKDGLKEYMTRLNEITGQLEEDQFEYFEDGLDDMGETSLDLWIGKSNRWLYKVVLEAEENGDKMKMELSLSKHNKQIEINAPENYTTVEEIFGGMMGAPSQIEDIDTDGDGLSDFEESIWETDVNNPDTDGDGYSDLEELENGYDPLGPGVLWEN